MTTTALLLATLLAMFHAPADRQRCMEARAASIAARAQDGARLFGVPPSVLLTVGYLETHLGCDPGEGGGWGAPLDARHRHTAGTHLQAAHILMRSFEVCHTWGRAIARFRCGYCRCRRYVGYSDATAVGIVRRLHARAGVPLPEAFTP